MTNSNKLHDFLKSQGVRERYLKDTDVSKYSVKFDQVYEKAKDKSLFIYGQVGVGKTQLAVDIIKKISQEFPDKIDITKYGEKERKYVDIFDPYLFKYFNTSRLLLAIKDTFADRQKTVSNIISSLDDYKYVVLDDLGSEKPSEWVFETLYVLINNRYENEQKFIITSNKTLKELSDSIGDRIASRLAEMCEIIKLEGDDKRL